MNGIVQSTNVTNQVTEYLKKQLIEGRWKPGEKIASEPQLTAELGVSRATLRNSIKQLAAIGVLESHQGKGTFVRAIAPESIERNMNSLFQQNKDMQDLLEFRMILESETCRLVAKRITPEELLELEKQFQEMKQEYQKADRSAEAFAEHDFGFHKILYYATRNKVIVESLKLVVDSTEKFQVQYNTDYLSERAVFFHEKILQALKDRDGEAAARAMRQHLMVVNGWYGDLLKNQ